MEYLWRLFLYRTENFCNCHTHDKVPRYAHCDIPMATQWAPSPLHSKGKIRVLLLQEVLFARVVHSVGVSEYRHYTTQAQKIPSDSGVTNEAFFILGRYRSANEYVAMVISKPVSQCVGLAEHKPSKVSTLGISICTDIPYFVILQHFVSTS